VKLLLDTQLPLWAAGQPDRPAIHLSGDSAIGFSGMEMETLVRYGMPPIVVFNNGGIGSSMLEIPDNPIFNLEPNALIYSARYDKMMEALAKFRAGDYEMHPLLCR
jgi:thiamine pyrophosphate-dependent acetolactate synthase large subunit-like protein